MNNCISTSAVNTCGCCKGPSQRRAKFNLPGKPALDYRLDKHSGFLSRMLAALATKEISIDSETSSRPLFKLGHRLAEDMTYALVDSWAMVADILTFYQERIANEGYLRTAGERFSVLQLARSIGYELKPGVAASAYLSFTVDDDTDKAEVARGSQIQNVPVPPNLPQTFETAESIVGARDWNSMLPCLADDQLVGNGKREVLLQGIDTLLLPGDSILFERSVWQTGLIKSLEPGLDRDSHFLLLDEKLADGTDRMLLSTPAINDVALFLDDNDYRAVSASSDSTLLVWDLESCQPVIGSDGEPVVLVGHTDGVNAVAAAPDGSRIISGSDDKTIKVWNLSDGVAEITLIGHKEGVNGIAVTGDGITVVSASADKTLRIWDLVRKKTRAILRGHNDSVNDVAITSDDKLVVSASADKTVKLWRLDNRKLVATLDFHEDAVNAVATTPIRNYIVSASADNTIKVWDRTYRCSRCCYIFNPAEAGQSFEDLPDNWECPNCGASLEEFRPSQPLTLQGHSGSVNDVVVDDQENFIISASTDKTIKVWDLKSGTVLLTIENCHRDIINSLALADGKLVSASSDLSLKIWNLESPTLGVLKGHELGVNDVVATPGGNIAISVSDDGTLRQWNLYNYQQFKMLKAHVDILLNRAASATGIALYNPGENESIQAISSSKDGTCTIWNLDTGSNVSMSGGEEGKVPLNDVAVIYCPNPNIPCSSWQCSGVNFLCKAFSCTAEDCDYVYDPSVGDPDHGIAPGTPFEDLPEDWTCPSCVAAKSEFQACDYIYDPDVGDLVHGIAAGTSFEDLPEDWICPTCGAKKSGFEACNYVYDPAVGDPDHGVDPGTFFSDLPEDWTCPLCGAPKVEFSRIMKRWAITACENATIRVWDLEERTLIKTLPVEDDAGHTASINGVAIYAFLDAGILKYRAVSASSDKTLMVWDLESGRVARSSDGEELILVGHTASVNSVAVYSILDDGVLKYRAISASSDRTLIVWDLETGSVAKTPDGKDLVLKGHRGGVNGVTVYPPFPSDGVDLAGGELIALSSSSDKTVKVWDLKTGMLLRTLEGHEGRVNSAAVTSLDDKLMALSASADKTIRVWSMEAGTLLGTLEGLDRLPYAGDLVLLIGYPKKAEGNPWQRRVLSSVVPDTWSKTTLLSLEIPLNEESRHVLLKGVHDAEKNGQRPPNQGLVIVGRVDNCPDVWQKRSILAKNLIGIVPLLNSDGVQEGSIEVYKLTWDQDDPLSDGTAQVLISSSEADKVQLEDHVAFETELWARRVIREVLSDPRTDTTLVRWKMPLNNLGDEDEQIVSPQVYALRESAYLFGYNAPEWSSLPDSVYAAYTGFPFYPGTPDWPGIDVHEVVNGSYAIDLDTIYPKVIQDSWVVLSDSYKDRLFWVDDVTKSSLSKFTLTSKVTGLLPHSTMGLIDAEVLHNLFLTESVVLDHPLDVTFYESKVYIADTDNDRIVILNKDDLSLIAEIAGWETESGPDQFNKPSGIAVGEVESGSKYIWVADTGNNRIVKLSVSSFIYVDEVSTWGSGSSVDQFNKPSGIDFGENYIWVADTDNDRILKLNASDLSYVGALATWGTDPNADQFNKPSGIAFCEDSGSNYILVADTDNDRVVKLNASDFGYVSEVSTWGTDPNVDQFNKPSGIALEEDDSSSSIYIYVADRENNRIVKLDFSNLSFVDIIESWPTGSGPGQFSKPSGVAFGDQCIWVADTDYNRVVKLATTGFDSDNFPTIFPILDLFFGGAFSIINNIALDNFPAYYEALTQTYYDIAIDGTYIYITDVSSNQIVKRKATDLSFVREISSFEDADANYFFNSPHGIATDGNFIYVSTNLAPEEPSIGIHGLLYDILFHLFIEGTDFIVKLNANDLSYVSRTSSYDDNQFENPQGIAADGNFIYIADTGNNRIVKLSAVDLSYIDQVGFDDGSAGAGNRQFNTPMDVASDGTFLFIADAGNHRILKLKASDLSYVNKVGSLGSSDDEFNYPSGIACDGKYIYVADSNNNRIVKRKASDLSYVSQIGTLGSGEGQFRYPFGLAVDTNYIYVVDRYNNRIVKTYFLDRDVSFSFKTRETSALIVSDPLNLAKLPRTGLFYGDRLELDRLIYGLERGKVLILKGKRMGALVLEDNLELEYGLGLKKRLIKGDVLKVTKPPQLDSEGIYCQWTLLDNDGFEGTLTAFAEAVELVEARESDPEISEVVVLLDVINEDGRTTLIFEQELENAYDVTSVQVHANVVSATHGEIIEEILGDGDGIQINQQFVLENPNLTYVSAPTSSGVESTLEVRVNDILWEEAPSLFALEPASQSYMVRLDNDGKSTLTFGDGVHGARLPTGLENITAVYRTGIGFDGEVGAESQTILLSDIPEIKSVVNPFPSSGAAPPERLEEARRHAPLSVQAMERIVSTQDFENFAETFAGIAKASSVVFPLGQTSLVYITVAASSGKELDGDSELIKNLIEAIDERRDPFEKARGQVLVKSFQRVTFSIEAKVRVDPRYIVSEVLAKVKEDLLEAFSFENRELAQPVRAGEAISVIQKVEGVVSADLDLLKRDDSLKGSTTILEARSAFRQDEVTILPAELLLLDPNGRGVVLQELKI